MSEIIRLENISVLYRETEALRGVSVSISGGEFVSVIGPNGSGKTTLLKVVNGLTSIVSGTVDVFNRRLSSGNLSSIRKRIGYVPQKMDVDIRAPISVYEAVSIGRFAVRGLFKKLNDQDRDIVHATMRSVGIYGLRERPVGHLSYGQQQKVSIARALAQQPDILLMDEPGSSLDIKALREITDIVEKVYNKSGLTVIYVTHALSHIPQSCQRAVFMRDGSVLRDGKFDDIKDEKILNGLYGCT